MTEDEFRNLVHKMRKTQIKYFATRSIDVLKESKRLESRVDDELDTEKYKPLTLFHK